MPLNRKLKHMLFELKSHMPFTLFGALLGVGFMLGFRNAPENIKAAFFNFSHPAHVVLSAMVTASMFRLHGKYKNFLIILVVGWVGSIGVATVSDIIIPHYLGKTLLGVAVPSHEVFHSEHIKEQSEHDHNLCIDEHKQHGKLHLGFIEEWYIVNPAALLGILMAFFWPKTKFPHAAHILISTWASSSYVLMTMTEPIGALFAIGFVLVLFISVWLPCCVSDIVFPLLFVEGDIECLHCHHISHHHHPDKKESRDE